MSIRECASWAGLLEILCAGQAGTVAASFKHNASSYKVDAVILQTACAASIWRSTRLRGEQIGHPVDASLARRVCWSAEPAVHPGPRSSVGACVVESDGQIPGFGGDVDWNEGGCVHRSIDIVAGSFTSLIR